MDSLAKNWNKSESPVQITLHLFFVPIGTFFCNYRRTANNESRAIRQAVVDRRVDAESSKIVSSHPREAIVIALARRHVR